MKLKKRSPWRSKSNAYLGTETLIPRAALSKNADWAPRDIEQDFLVKPAEIKYFKLDVAYNLSEMNLGQPKPSYVIHLRPMRSDDAIYALRTTNAIN